MESIKLLYYNSVMAYANIKTTTNQGQMNIKQATSVIVIVCYC